VLDAALDLIQDKQERDSQPQRIVRKEPISPSKHPQKEGGKCLGISTGIELRPLDFCGKRNCPFTSATSYTNKATPAARE